MELYSQPPTSDLTLFNGSITTNLFVAKTTSKMIVDHAYRLHEGIANRGADKLKTPA